MSYEGEEVILCRNGHKSVYNCYDLPDPNSWKCSICEEPGTWWEGIDWTNGNGYRTELKLYKEEKVSYPCPVCGNKHYSTNPQYYIPWDKMAKRAKQPALVPYKVCEVVHGTTGEILEED